MSIGNGNAYYKAFRVGYRTSDYYVAWTSYYNSLNTTSQVITGWNHIAVTWDGVNSVKLYLNGAEVGTLTTTNVNTNTSDIAIGGKSWSPPEDNLEDAWMAEAIIYNRALSASEITALANEFTPTA